MNVERALMLASAMLSLAALFLAFGVISLSKRVTALERASDPYLAHTHTDFFVGSGEAKFRAPCPPSFHEKNSDELWCVLGAGK